ncbi:DEAD/DEAH box helicase [Streptomyces sp. NPDC018972]|uniref:DEAD/DEAH box helicase n=1 Tax=Streptomyces sp. NPDC018972 TaxID=3365060 RepID=UPI003790E689
MHVATSKVWAQQVAFARNVVRQLLVPSGPLEVLETAASLEVASVQGRWPAIRAGGKEPEQLTAVIPTVRTGGRVGWIGDSALRSPQAVLDSFVDGIGFRDHAEPHALRRPQIGALHSVIGYWASGVTAPGIVVMPTGTGKTETMLALLVAARPERLLVLVPTAALRDQIAAKFESLGILHTHQIVTPSVMRPVVGKLLHGFRDAAEAAAFAAACNVVVATPHALQACEPEAREVLLAAFSHLMVDEAHHAPAPSWSRVVEAFSDRHVLLFTATPFREDGRPVPGRTIFRFPLREAQRDGYFTPVNYRAVLSLEDTDRALAQLAVTQLRADLDAGLDHIVMARARSIARAKELGVLYQSLAPELNPTVLHEKVATRARRAALAALQDRSCRIVVCVDMLGEGFDLPALKIAALHDVKKSLSPMIQFIGRFTRSTSTNSTIGTASVFVARDPSVALSPLRELLREDADWDTILHDITERATASVEELSDFEASFTDAPEEVSVTVLEPKMSAIAHRAPGHNWTPERALAVYGDGRILDSTIAVNTTSTVAWFVVENRSEVRWGAPQALEQITYELIIMYFSRIRGLLYIHGSNNTGDYRELAQAVLGMDSRPVTGMVTFRVLGHMERLIPTNVGLLDSRDHFNRFSMHVGSDVYEALTTADRQGKSQTHIAASGFRNGEKTTISAALSGRFWSMQTAPNLKAWTNWCDEQGAKLTDTSIDLASVMDGFIFPEDLTERPEGVLIAAEWPWPLFTGSGPGPQISYAGTSYPAVDVALEVADHSPTGPFRVRLATPVWQISYSADFTHNGLTYTPDASDGHVRSGIHEYPLQEWINRNKPTLFLAGDKMITAEDRLLAPRKDLAPFDRRRLTVLDWAEVDIQKEAQTATREPDSIQAYISAHLQESHEFDVLIDDDRAREAADLVGMKIDGDELVVTLVHCKYSSEPTPGGRVADLYELCGQAVRGAKWRQDHLSPLLNHLDRRARSFRARTGVSPFEVGNIEELYRIRELAPQLRPRIRTVLAQPGLSAAACTEEQLRLLAGAETYVHALTRGTFVVYCSA